MYLEELEIFGFKSFGHRVNLKFPKGVTCVIGPNGVGKSNLVEAIRWALGEQSLKTLRSKKGEDIIFSGGQIRLNLAEVFLYLKNKEKNPQPPSQQLMVGRKILRNGENEYFINQNKVKLQDVLLTIAKANFGPKSYSVIGQGMVDSILYSSPLERKEFFAEATGVRKYQLKRKEAMIKLKRSQENFAQAEIALKEIEPRMRFLTRQIKKLSKRQEIERKLLELQKKYYGSKKFKLEKEGEKLKREVEKIKEEVDKKSVELKFLQEEFKKISDEKGSIRFAHLQKEYQISLEERRKLLETISILQAKSTLNENKQEKFLERERLARIEDAFKEFLTQQEELIIKLEKIKRLEELKEIRINFIKITDKLKRCLEIFQEKKYPSSKKLKETEENLKIINQKIKDLEINLQDILKEEENKRKEVISQQEKIQKKQEEMSQISFSLKEKEIELARLETKKEDLEEEIKRDCLDQNILSLLENKLLRPEEEEEIFLKIKKLKHQLETIEAIDPNISQEYDECSQRYNFLSSQTNDLKKAINSLKKIKEKLDERIKKEFITNFNRINQEFEKYFKILFKGGRAKLVLEEKKEQESLEIEEEKEEELIIEILARPPAKKIKTLETLSGGEKALTSLALIFAIIKIKNPPFVVLDEVDAALDEINSLRFTEIIKDLARKIQFIIVTHNNVTMETADVVYGMTMKTDNTTHLFSLKLERV